MTGVDLVTHSQSSCDSRLRTSCAVHDYAHATLCGMRTPRPMLGRCSAGAAYCWLLLRPGTIARDLQKGAS